MPRLRTTIRGCGFGFGSLLVLIIGFWGAQVLWRMTHHRYERPSTGFYYGRITATIKGLELPFYLSFQGETSQRWYWTLSGNFAYDRLRLEWRGYGDGASEGAATLSLPSFRYESPGSNGILTSEVLAGWLLGHSGMTTNNGEAGLVEAAYAYLQDAANGTLPPPSHHGFSSGYDSPEPLMVRIQHFRIGYGVGGFAYIWITVWVLANAVLTAWCLGKSQKAVRGEKVMG